MNKESIQQDQPPLKAAAAEPAYAPAPEESRDRHISLYDFAPVGYLTLTHDGMIGEINPAATALLGMGRSELMRRRFVSFVAPEDRDRWHRCFMSVLEHGNKLRCELAFLHDDESHIHVQLDCMCLEKKGGEPMVHIALTDITRMKQTEEEFKKFFNLLPDLSCVVSADGYFLRINPRWTETLGYTEQEILSTPYLDFIHPDDKDATAKEMELQLAGKSTLQFVNRCRCKDGGYKWLEWKAAPAANKKLIYAAARDITGRKEIEQALVSMDRRKDAFLAMLAHELRNPLASIRNAAHVIGKLEQTAPKILWAQKIIEEQSGHLAHMVDDLLDVSRIARNKITLKKETIRLAKLIEQVIESIRPLVEHKGHQLTFRLTGQAVQLQGDPVRLSQVLLNLLDNAIKYTPNGGQIELAARMAGEEIEISVRDNGMGVTAELLPHVFDLFQQDERTLDRSHGGLGIGLTLVQRLVSMHGGRVKADSEGPGLGSTFTVWLPAQIIPARPQAPGSSDHAHHTRSVRVLVVDDDYFVSDSTAVMLEMNHHEVRIAHTGQAALEIVPDFRPDVVLLDIGLKGMNGFETAQRLRELKEGRDLCVVCVTGYGDEKTRAQAMASGCDHFLVKPVAYDALNALLNTLALEPR